MSKREIRHIPNNPSLQGLARMVPNVVFSTEQGQDLTLQLFVPWSVELPEHSVFPLVVFVQGSAWTSPDVYYEIPQLAQLAREGYVVATVTHRNSLEGHPFPAFLQDVKTAIRFLRANAEKYGIDPERVGIFGTSSGGNISLLVGLTGDDPRYKTEEYSGESDAVKMAVECFGPADLPKMADVTDVEETPIDKADDIFKAIMANPEMKPEEILLNMSPALIVEEGKAYPPFLLIHGDKDEAVPYDQGLIMFDRLLDAGVDAEMICVDGAPHEGNFWSNALWAEIKCFLDKRL